MPLASGYLSGKYKPGTTFATSDVRSGYDQKQIDEKQKAVDAARQELEEISEQARKAGVRQKEQ